MAVDVKALALDRDEFASFLKTYKQIKQFEKLFATVIEHSIAIEGLQCAPVTQGRKRARCGQFLDTTTQAASGVSTATAITYNTTSISNGVFLRPGNSEISVDTEGLYNFQFSIQLDKIGGGTENFWIWPRLNGVDIPNSASQVRIQGNDAEIFCAANFFVEMNASDYVELMFAVSDVSVELTSFAASAFCPSVPSIIVTVSSVSKEA